MEIKGGAGFGGTFGFLKIDARGRRPGQVLDVRDLLDLEGGVVRVKDEARIVEEVWSKNKWTKRGLARCLHQILIGHSGGTYTPSDITYSPTLNPFVALILVSDHTTGGKIGDARVEWNESDGAYVSAVPNASNPAREGRRGCLISDTSGILKRVSITYPSTTPYREIEYTFYASAVAMVRSVSGDGTDSIVVSGSLVNLLNGNFSVADIGRVLRIRGAANVGNNHDRMITAVNSATQVVVDVTDFALTNEAGDFMDESFPDGVYAAPNLTGDKSLDFFPIKGIGLAAGLAAGDGEAASQWGIRSIIGQPPTLQGICDRVYVHEGSGLTLYSNPADAITVEGYTESGHNTTYSGDKGFDGDVEEQGISGVIDQGDKWFSVDGAGPHKLGRIWTATKTVKGVRVVMPPNVAVDYAPNRFEFQYLNPSANGGNPRPANDADWLDWPSNEGKFLTSDQGVTIYNNGQYGIEYVFTTPVATKGVRIMNITAYNTAKGAQIAEFYIFEEMAAVSLTKGTDRIRMKTKATESHRNFNLLTIASTKSVSTLLNGIDPALRGFELEAVRSSFGFLWIRGTVAGGQSTIWLDTVANGSVSNAKLGLNTAGDTNTGITRPVKKEPTEGLAIIYRANISGDLVVAS